MVHVRSSAPRRISDLKNLGAVSERRLNEVGIRTLEDLERVGAAAAYGRVKSAYPRDTSLVLLYALQGAIWDIHWNALPIEVKESLKAEVSASDS